MYWAGEASIGPIWTVPTSKRSLAKSVFPYAIALALPVPYGDMDENGFIDEGDVECVVADFANAANCPKGDISPAAAMMNAMWAISVDPGSFWPLWRSPPHEESPGRRSAEEGPTRVWTRSRFTGN